MRHLYYKLPLASTYTGTGEYSQSPKGGSLPDEWSWVESLPLGQGREREEQREGWFFWKSLQKSRQCKVQSGDLSGPPHPSGIVLIFRWVHVVDVVVQSLSRVWLFCNPVDCSPPSSSVHGTLRVRMGCCHSPEMGCHFPLHFFFILSHIYFSPSPWVIAYPSVGGGRGMEKEWKMKRKYIN